MNGSSKFLAAALAVAAAPFLVASAAAAPISAVGLQNAAPSIEAVQYRRGWRGDYRGRGLGGAGIVAGALIGGAIIGATQPYGYGGYGYGPYGAYGYAPGYSGYYDQGYVDQGYVAVSPYAGGRDVAYCQQRFRSYDAASGTYLGFDGMRHPCP